MQNSCPLHSVRWELSAVNNWAWGPSKTPRLWNSDAEVKELGTSFSEHL